MLWELQQTMLSLSRTQNPTTTRNSFMIPSPFTTLNLPNATSSCHTTEQTEGTVPLEVSDKYTNCALFIFFRINIYVGILRIL